MKRSIILIALIALFAANAEAQIVGANTGGQTQSKTGFFRGQSYTTKGNRIFLIGCGVGLGAGLVGVAVSGEVSVGLASVASGALWGAIIATPFWIKGYREKRGYTYIPMLEYDVPLNEHLSLNTSIGTIPRGQVLGFMGIQEPVPGIGVNLMF